MYKSLLVAQKFAELVKKSTSDVLLIKDNMFYIWPSSSSSIPQKISVSRLYISLTWHIYDFHHVGGTLTKESHWLVLFVILFSSNMADWPSKALFSESQGINCKPRIIKVRNSLIILAARFDFLLWI